MHIAMYEDLGMNDTINDKKYADTCQVANMPSKQ